jgi:hypothetical protein
MIPMRLFSSRAFSAANAACFLFTGALYAAVFFNAQFLQTAQGYEPLAAGLRLLPWTATLFIFAPLGGRLVSRLGERPLIVVGLVMQAVGMAWHGATASKCPPPCSSRGRCFWPRQRLYQHSETSRSGRCTWACSLACSCAAKIGRDPDLIVIPWMPGYTPERDADMLDWIRGHAGAV